MGDRFNTTRPYTEEDILDYGAYLDLYYVMGGYNSSAKRLKTYFISSTIKQSVRIFLKKIMSPWTESSFSEEITRATLRVLFDTPFEEIPTLIGHRYDLIRVTAEWRLKRGI
ncbi:MAG: hypothetical protein GF334_10945 [Candidatus Altiarchaeales archaeon]|nr:hypothetical protein [Candidatus Altiarchaeales archaeon]